MHPLLGGNKTKTISLPSNNEVPHYQQEPAVAPANTPGSVARTAALHTNLSRWSGSLGSLVRLFPKAMEGRIQT